MQTILIIEDNPFIQEFYKDLFISENYRLVLANTGQEGLEKSKVFKPSLIILNYEITSHSIIIELKKNTKNSPVIAVTGKEIVDPEIRLSKQLSDFFIKPIHGEKLLQSVKKNLKRIRTITQIGGYTLLNKIAHSGCGEVYEGMKFGNKVAIKLLPKDSEKNPAKIERFRRESRILTNLKHKNIINIIDFGYEQERFFIIMEYFEGRSVQNILDERKFFSIAQGINIIMQVAAGMEVGHIKKLIHRDIKPSNILYNEKQKLAKIIDFGTAREIEVDQQVTGPGVVVGTPYYMSPEQCQAMPLDERSDIYNLGITFYQILTGKLPFAKKNAIQTMFAHIGEKLPWPKNTRSIPGKIKKIIEKMVAKKVEERYQNMKEIFEELKHYGK